jgi:hypothetical protein
MIRYDLICDKGHEFDGWFSDSGAFEKQAKRGFVECTVCGSSRIEKQLMRPNIGAKSNKRADAAPQKMAAGPVDPRLEMMLKMARDIRKHVQENAEHVGDSFAREARKIHYGEAEERGIYGSATADEARGLIEEGIAVSPLPPLPEDRN